MSAALAAQLAAGETPLGEIRNALVQIEIAMAELGDPNLASQVFGTDLWGRLAGLRDTLQRAAAGLYARRQSRLPDLEAAVEHLVRVAQRRGSWLVEGQRSPERFREAAGLALDLDRAKDRVRELFAERVLLREVPTP